MVGLIPSHQDSDETQDSDEAQDSDGTQDSDEILSSAISQSEDPVLPLTRRQIMHLAFGFFLISFTCGWSGNVALKLTTVSSATILGSISGK